jgi:AraC-like DNA-binding protein
MPIAPLAGPDRLYTVTVAPRFLLDSNRVGWQGAFFTSIVGAPTGTVDHGHERYCLQRTFGDGEARRVGRGSWGNVPAGVSVWQLGDEVRMQWRRGGRSQFLFVAPEQAERMLDHVPSRMAGQRLHEPVRSRVLELVFDALEADLAQGSPAGPLVGEALIAAAFVQLAGLPEGGAAALAAPARERVVGFIEAHLAQAITLADLAAVAGVGVRQLCRSWRASTGESPHQFILRRRVDRAKVQIAGGAPLADVALACGFSDQSQLTRTFTRHAGVSPGRYRAQLRR